jgi:hypothetical protein
MSDAITWEQPPGKDRQNWAEIAEALRANPDRWAKIESASTAYCSFIKQGRTKAFQPAGSFEARLRGGKVYARFIGGKR